MLSLTKKDLVSVLSLAVTLTVAHALKLHLLGGLTLDGFTRSWLIASGGIIAGSVVNTLVTTKILNKLKESGKYDDLRMTLISDILNTVVLLTVQQIIVSGVKGKVSFSSEWFRGIFLVISGILLYNILIDPLVPDDIPHRSVIVGVLKKTSAIATGDYMSDLDFDNFPIEAGTTAAGILVGDLSSTPISDALNASPE